MTTKDRKAKFAVCINNSEYPASLELHKIYRVVLDDDADKGEDIRIIDESGEGYLYPRDWFIFIEVPNEVEKSLTHH